MPAQSVESEGPTYSSDNSNKEEEVRNEVEDNGDDDDDWDAFQSIPATAPPNADSYNESVAHDTTAGSDDVFQSFPASTPPNEDLEVESTGEPSLINDNHNVIESPSNASHSEFETKFGEEEPTPEEHPKADNDEVLSSSPTDAIQNFDFETGFDTNGPTPLDDSKIHCRKVLDQPSAMSIAPEFESEAGLDKEEPSTVDSDRNEALHLSPLAAVMSKVESKAGLELEEPSSVDIDSNEALHSSPPSAVTGKVESEHGFNNTAPADGIKADTNEADIEIEEPTSVNEALQTSPIDVKPEVESKAELNSEANDIVGECDESTHESPVCSNVLPELQDTKESCSKSSDS